jgi:hypothetical protein
MGISILNKNISRGIKTFAICKLVKRTMENELNIQQVAKNYPSVKWSCNCSFFKFLILYSFEFFCLSKYGCKFDSLNQSSYIQGESTI